MLKTSLLLMETTVSEGMFYTCLGTESDGFRMK